MQFCSLSKLVPQSLSRYLYWSRIGRIKKQRQRVPAATCQRLTDTGREIGGEVLLANGHATAVDIEHDRRCGIRLDCILDPLDLSGLQGETGNSQRHAVAEEDLRERDAHDAVDAPALQTLRRMLARGSTAEIRASNENRRTLKLRPVERVPAVRLGAIILEGMLSEAVKGDAAQETRRDDAIGIDVVATDGDRAALDPAHLSAVLARIVHLTASYIPINLWLLEESPDVDDLASHRSRRDHGGTHEESAARRASLPSLEVPVG